MIARTPSRTGMSQQESYIH